MSKNWWLKDWELAGKKQKRSRGVAYKKRKKAFGGASLAPEFVIAEHQWLEHVSSLPTDYCLAVVVERHKKWVWVGREEKESGGKRWWDVDHLVRAVVGGKYWQLPRRDRDLVTVGDEVICYGDHSNPVYVLHRRERRNTLTRSEAYRKGVLKEQVLGSNIDQLVVVSSFYGPRVFWKLIDRYLVWAALQQMKALLVFTKKDLLGDSDHKDYEAEVHKRIEHYRDLGWGCYVVDSHDPQELQGLWSGQVSLLSGLSGVGKSSLVNSCGGRVFRKVGQSGAFGRHTTSTTRLIALESGGLVMDSPGIQSLELSPDLKDQFVLGFPEFASYEKLCYFPNCSHRSEPGCQVRSAAEEGLVASWRYSSYLSLYEQALNHEFKPS